jgi:hypothetical protein
LDRALSARESSARNAVRAFWFRPPSPNRRPAVHLLFPQPPSERPGASRSRGLTRLPGRCRPRWESRSRPRPRSSPIKQSNQDRPSFRRKHHLVPRASTRSSPPGISSLKENSICLVWRKPSTTTAGRAGRLSPCRRLISKVFQARSKKPLSSCWNGDRLVAKCAAVAELFFRRGCSIGPGMLDCCQP